jgi:EF-hand domain pair/AhpC/TSA family/EF hand
MMVRRLFPLLLLAGLGPAGAAPAAEPPRPGNGPGLLAAFAPLGRTEAGAMLAAILSGAPPGPPHGWFHPAQSRYGWPWLAGRYDADRDGVITRKEFTGPAELFERLDRNHDGRLTPEDLDWSAKSPLNRQLQQAAQLFRQADRDTDGRVSADEWQALFRKAARGKDGLLPEDLHALLFPPPPREGPSGDSRPSRFTLLMGLLSGEIGSSGEGPKVGQVAPAFTLQTHDGRRTVALADYRGKRPVVLVFGSFT